MKDHGLWACHLGPELGGQGYGQLKLALLNEILGRSRWAPSVFGCQAPDSGNAEILAHYGTDEQKAKYLQPLLDGEISSCYSMTEPHAGADPTLFTTRAERDGDEWVINGEKWFSSNARFAELPHRDGGHQPRGQRVPGHVDVHRPRRHAGRRDRPQRRPRHRARRTTARHGYMRYTDVRVPADHLLGGEGQAFVIAQTRLGGGRIHHAMRTIAMLRQAFDMMCERAAVAADAPPARWRRCR